MFVTAGMTKMLGFFFPSHIWRPDLMLSRVRKMETVNGNGAMKISRRKQGDAGYRILNIRSVIVTFLCPMR